MIASLGRGLALMVVGAAALLLGASRWDQPARAEERTGWLYQQFGDQGVVLGTLAMGLMFLVLGLILTVRAGRRLRHYRHTQGKEANMTSPKQHDSAPASGPVKLFGWVMLVGGALWTLFYAGSKVRAMAAGAASVEYGYLAVLIGPVAVALGLFYLLIRPGTLQGVQAMDKREQIFFLIFIVTGVLAGVGLGAWLSAQAEAYGYFG